MTVRSHIPYDVWCSQVYFLGLCFLSITCLHFAQTLIHLLIIRSLSMSVTGLQLASPSHPQDASLKHSVASNASLSLDFREDKLELGLYAAS